MIIDFPCDPSFDGEVTFFARATGAFVGEFAQFQLGAMQSIRRIDATLSDGDYYIETSSHPSLFCCRVENQVATIADFWPQLDMLRAMQAGKAYNWTNQANEVLRVAIQEAS